ncbi:hypothetical protein [Halobacteriovorax sp. JY17]|uniref:hypothetical protein n=1 Tax=Halobacteriovorax sp. JY17 TaxID=2014617 RepID=UPI000C5F838D|nr:hypothetical protein [Halobacteriovorax sp. JY17]PIK14884.1 MAG: hypothetical protein CES88_11165 [Halobacteriovorax sp. JY17]
MKRLIFSLIILISLVLIFFFYKKKEINNPLETTSSKSKTSLKVGEVSDQKSNLNERSNTDECDTYKKVLSDPKLENLENRRWSNFHIKHTDGEVYRIRYFYDDGPNGEYKKTILYKEDETEFPHIVKTYRGFESEELKGYFSQGEIIWQEQAYETIYEGKAVYWRKINDEFVDLNIDEGLSCL